MFDVCYYENYRNESRLQTEAGASPHIWPWPITRDIQGVATTSHLVTTWDHRPRARHRQTPARGDQSHPRWQVWRPRPPAPNRPPAITRSICWLGNFVRWDNYINDQDKQFRYKHDLIMRCHPGCYVQSVLLKVWPRGGERCCDWLLLSRVWNLTPPPPAPHWSARTSTQRTPARESDYDGMPGIVPVLIMLLTFPTTQAGICGECNMDFIIIWK